MLKVIGASMQKTRIGTYILISAGLLVIGGFFIGYVERPQYDGTYCATTFWSQYGGFHIEYWKQQNDLLNIPQGAARICYKDTLLDDGWEQIEIETQRSFPDSVQAYGAGLLEGSLTWNSIYHQWMNVIQNFCDRNNDVKYYCAWLRDLMTKNYEELKEYATLNAEHDHFWHQISLYFNQLEGLEAGYMRGAKRARFEEGIPFSDFLLMNSMPEIIEFSTYFYKYVAPRNGSAEEEGVTFDKKKAFNWPKTSMLMKIFEDQGSWQLLFGHCTMENYSSVKRMQKRYKFHYHYSPSQRSNIVPGVDITFSGIPGLLASTDDFYIVKGHLMQSIVAGVKLKTAVSKLSFNVTKPFVPLLARIIAANRIASNRRIWAKTMTQYPHIAFKQWITADLYKLAMINNLHSKGRTYEKPEQYEKYNDVVWIVEQMAGYSKRKDVTDMFFQKNGSSWITDGMPYFEEIVNASGLTHDNYYYNMTLNGDSELLSLEAVGKYLRLHTFSDNVDEHTHFDVKLFSYNSKLGVKDHSTLVGPMFLRFRHILPLQTKIKEDNEMEISQNVVYTDKEIATLAGSNMKKRSIQYFFNKKIIQKATS